LRVYNFYSPDRSDSFPVGRAIKEGHDHWFFIDPDSIPARVYEHTEEAIKAAAKLTYAKAVFGTMDFGYGSISNESPDWQGIEMNSKQPYMIGYDKHRQIAHHLRVLFADQVRFTAAV
jgi:hypothetical protein